MGLLKRIHINRHVIRENNIKKKNNPPLRVKTYNDNIEGHEISILGPSKVIYSPDKPLSCGAKVWIETTSPVELITHSEGGFSVFNLD